MQTLTRVKKERRSAHAWTHCELKADGAEPAATISTSRAHICWGSCDFFLCCCISCVCSKSAWKNPTTLMVQSVVRSSCEKCLLAIKIKGQTRPEWRANRSLLHHIQRIVRHSRAVSSIVGSHYKKYEFSNCHINQMSSKIHGNRLMVDRNGNMVK